MVSLLALSVVDRGFEPRSGQTKDYKIGIFCFSAKHALKINFFSPWYSWKIAEMALNNYHSLTHLKVSMNI